MVSKKILPPLPLTFLTDGIERDNMKKSSTSFAASRENT
jgi:hypothetical protein